MRKGTLNWSYLIQTQKLKVMLLTEQQCLINILTLKSGVSPQRKGRLTPGYSNKIKNAFFFPLASFPETQTALYKGEWKWVEKIWGIAKLFLMNWDWCIWKVNYIIIGNAVSQNNNKILKRFKPNNFAEFWGKILFPNLLHSGVFFFFCSKRVT